MHLEASGCVRTRSENFGNFGPENAIFVFLEGILTAWGNLRPLPDLRERHLDVYVWGGVMPISLLILNGKEYLFLPK